MKTHALKEYKRWFGLKRFFRIDWWMIKLNHKPKSEFYKMVKLTNAFEQEVVDLEESLVKALNELSNKQGTRNEPSNPV